MTELTYHTLQKNVVEYCEKLSDKELVSLIDTFVFYNETDDDIILNGFLEHYHAKNIHDRHMNDIKKQPYFLSCSGSDLHFLENLKTFLLVGSYNRFRHETIRNISKTNKRKKKSD